MKNETKHTPGPWVITNNTDTIDIDQKCVGLSPWRKTIPSDVANHIHSNRGLHVQIRHNGDSQTYAQANDLARLVAAAPELLKALELVECRCLSEDKTNWELEQKVILRLIHSALAQVRGDV